MIYKVSFLLKGNVAKVPRRWLQLRACPVRTSKIGQHRCLDANTGSILWRIEFSNRDKET